MAEIICIVQRVKVAADLFQRDVHCYRLALILLTENTNSRVRDFPDRFDAAIGAAVIYEKQLQPWVRLRQHAFDSGTEELSGIEDAHHDRDDWVTHFGCRESIPSRVANRKRRLWFR
jgi:hypothetical protein